MISKKLIPPSYGWVTEGKTTVVFKNSYRNMLIQMGITDPKHFFSWSPEMIDSYRGRGTVITIPLPGEGTGRLVIRKYRRGGKMQKVTADLYWGRSRPLRELEIASQALQKGVPTAEIIAACHHRVWGMFHRGHLVSLEIPRGQDIVSYARDLQRPLTRDRIREKREVISIVGHLIRTMHDAGIVHADLNLKNIILQNNAPDPPQGYIIDFDKSRIKPSATNRERIGNLMRLNRSVEKFRKEGVPITRTDALRFLLAYYRHPPNFRSVIQKLNRRYQRHMRYRRLGKKILDAL
ncbi:MAG: phosphotransferase [Deltaproteobacteria bacterium]|nr:phosphotransferase [Deltaproteobacteria bacterium]